MYKAPKSIISHPGVAECDDALARGCELPNRHDVLLKDGWTFEGLDHFAVRQCGFFASVQEFKNANPMRVSDVPRSLQQ